MNRQDLRELRKFHQIRLVDLAEGMGVSPTLILNTERGTRRVTLFFLIQLIRVFQKLVAGGKVWPGADAYHKDGCKHNRWLYVPERHWMLCEACHEVRECVIDNTGLEWVEVNGQRTKGNAV